jgi:hypothetical protein
MAQPPDLDDFDRDILAVMEGQKSEGTKPGTDKRHTGRRPKARQPGDPFRTSKAARTMSYEWKRSLTEETAYEWFKSIRFRDNDGQPFCPSCGSTDYYDMKPRKDSKTPWNRLWSCAEPECRKQYSMTSGTIFHSRKIKFLRLADLLFRFAECAKGTSATELGISFDGQYRTLWVNLMKMREAMSSRRDGVRLSGTVEMDAAFFGKTARPRNLKVDRGAEGPEEAHQRGKRALVVLRQRGGKSVMFAADGETQEVARAAVQAVLDPDIPTTIVTDESGAYDRMERFGQHLTVPHKVGYEVERVNTNQAESSFSRARRSHIGVYHKISPTWIDLYAGEICWREDQRRLGNREQATDIMALALTHGQSRNLTGIWQNHELPKDKRGRKELRWERVEERLRHKRAAGKGAGPDPKPDDSPTPVDEVGVTPGRKWRITPKPR